MSLPEKAKRNGRKQHGIVFGQRTWGYGFMKISINSPSMISSYQLICANMLHSNIYVLYVLSPSIPPFNFAGHPKNLLAPHHHG